MKCLTALCPESCLLNWECFLCLTGFCVQECLVLLCKKSEGDGSGEKKKMKDLIREDEKFSQKKMKIKKTSSTFFRMDDTKRRGLERGSRVHK